MDITTTIILAIALAMDCFAVSITVGLTWHKYDIRGMIKIAMAFGLFQAIMPLIGWLCSAWCGVQIADYDHFIAFGLLAFIGGKMLLEAIAEKEESKPIDINNWRTLIGLAIATSIDALAVGVTYGLMQVDITVPCIIIGIVAALFAIIGIVIGISVGDIFGNKAEIMGGIILILLGVKILIEHLYAD